MRSFTWSGSRSDGGNSGRTGGRILFIGGMINGKILYKHRRNKEFPSG